MNSKKLTTTDIDDGAYESTGFKGQRFYAFILAVISANFTLWFQHYATLDVDLSRTVIQFEVIIGIVLVAGRSAKYIIEAYVGRPGKVEEQTISKKTVTKK